MSRRKRFCWFAFLSLLAVTVFLAVTRPSSPDGRYVANPNIGAVGDFWWKFSDGNVSFVCVGVDYDRDKMKPHLGPDDRFGNYSKTKDGWLWINNYGHSKPNSIKIECSWFGLHLSTADGQHEFWRRRFFPGCRPFWMLRWLPDCIQ